MVEAHRIIIKIGSSDVSLVSIAMLELIPTDASFTAIEVGARKFMHNRYAASGLAASALRAEGGCRGLFTKHKMKHKRSINEV